MNIFELHYGSYHIEEWVRLWRIHAVTEHNPTSVVDSNVRAHFIFDTTCVVLKCEINTGIADAKNSECRWHWKMREEQK